MLEFLKTVWRFLKNAASYLEKSHNLADWIFTIIILFISTTSFFHVVEYWTLTNKFPFHFVTAVATELVIIGSMMAMRYTYVAWVPFILGVLVQGIGNIFYSYINIDVNSDYFKQFMELFKPLFELAYGDELEVANYKRVLAYSNGVFYLSPIVFLWAKMSLKAKIKKLSNQTPTSSPSTPSISPLPPSTPITPPDNLNNDDQLEITSNPTSKLATPTDFKFVDDSHSFNYEIAPEDQNMLAFQHIDAEKELTELLNQQVVEEEIPQPKLDITIPTETSENSIIDKIIENPISTEEKKN